MNERMIELYTQAQKFAYKNISEEYWNTDNFHAIVSGKFGELIVRESISALEEKIHRSIDHEGDEIWADLILKEHFGVEE